MTIVFDADDRGDFDVHAWEGWAVAHGFSLDNVYRIEVLGTKVRIFEYKTDDYGLKFTIDRKGGKDVAREKPRTITPIFPVPV